LPRSWVYPLLGALLALGLVLGLPTVHALDAARLRTTGFTPLAWGTTASVILCSMGVVATLGFLLGRWHDRVTVLSFTDPLTGLFNRRYFGERMTASLLRARRLGCSICVLCIDLDHLKRINDGRGHGAGDDALISVADTITNNLRPTDMVARFGGDEFVVLLPDTSVAEASNLSERIVAAVSRLSVLSTGHIEVSIGVSALNLTADPKDLLAAADEALYLAKAAGGGHSTVAGAEPQRRSALLEGVRVVKYPNGHSTAALSADEDRQATVGPMARDRRSKS
jgi:diguanylate cyclase (GGDEF)-like protein